MVIVRSPDSSHIVPPAGSSHNYCRYSAPVQPFRPLRTVALLAVSYRPAPSPCQLRSRSKPASCFRHRVPLSGVHLPLRLMSRWPSSSAAPHSPPCPEELTGDPLPGFDAATCHWSCWRLRGARSTPLSPSRRGSFSAAEAYSTHTPGGRGSALIDADLIKGL
jgi:hypothetical protein